MQPLCSAANPKAGFIHVLDRRRCDMVSHHIGKALEAPGTVAADPGYGRGHQLHPEEIGQQLDQTLLGQQVVVQEMARANRGQAHAEKTWNQSQGRVRLFQRRL